MFQACPQLHARAGSTPPCRATPAAPPPTRGPALTVLALGAAGAAVVLVGKEAHTLALALQAGLGVAGGQQVAAAATAG